ncbi:MAG: thiamine-phosphate kinase [Acaryochloridaceae cyanobacterium SU_2_1]|nr:thiamine-phosphate kinase [Acaryochloridaceae cyanobacterium SU_2_1]
MEDPPQDLTVADLGEQQLLQRLYRFCAAEMVGDDGAVLTPQGDHLLVVTTDMLVEGVHFSDRTTSPEDIGWRSAAANLSDLAAMGASPLGLTLSLGLPATQSIHWLESLYTGMADCLRTYQTAIIGGDLCQAPLTVLSITAVGELLPHHQILRSTAQPGDAIVISGPHGMARAGLESLLNPSWDHRLTPDQRLAYRQAHQRPEPRLDLLPYLRQLCPTRVTGMDSSDGLADAILQICRASQVGAILNQDLISLAGLAQSSLSPAQQLEWVLYGGEDFELVLCLPPSPAQQLVQALGQGAAIVGHTTETQWVGLIDAEGNRQPLEIDQGFQHFRQ